MNTLMIEAALARKYKYKPLLPELSIQYRKLFFGNIPCFLDVQGSPYTQLYTSCNTLICNGYDRVVVGDYGAFLELSEEQICANLIIKKGQEYRVNDEKYKNNVKYVWLTVDDGSDVKIYLQKKGVAYADYQPGKYYISVHEVFHEFALRLHKKSDADILSELRDLTNYMTTDERANPDSWAKISRLLQERKMLVAEALRRDIYREYIGRGS